MSLRAVAPVPWYSPKIPLFRKSSCVKARADAFFVGGPPATKNREKDYTKVLTRIQREYF